MSTRKPPRTALAQGPQPSFTELSASYLVEYESKIRYAIEPLSDAQIWWRPKGRTNSIGNLLLHLAGNLSLWIRKSIGEDDFDRDRSGEFAAIEGSTGAELMDDLSTVVDRTVTVIREVGDPSNLGGLERTLDIQGYSTTVMNSIFHAVEHMSYHTGQIVWVAKQLLSADDSFEMYPRHESE